MGYYRLYFFRLETGHIREVREFEAPHDFAAIYEAAKWRSNESMELWSGDRKVTRWAAADAISAVECRPPSPIGSPAHRLGL